MSTSNINNLQSEINDVNDVNDVSNDEQIEYWTEDNERVVRSWLDLLKYNNLIYYFYFFKVKRIEGRWAWLLIVLSVFASSISLFQFQEIDPNLEIVVKILLGIFTILTSLIAAWMKKQNYIERVSELDKYILKTSKIIGALEADLDMPIENRIEYDIFMKKYKEKIVEFNSTTPLISPDDWKETVYEITKYYPEIAFEIYPWKVEENFGQSIVDTYRYIKYNSFIKKLLRCFYCQSKCCMKKYDSTVLEKNINNIYKKKILNYDIEKNVNKPKLYQGVGLFLNPKTKLQLPVSPNYSSGNSTPKPKKLMTVSPKKHFKSGNTNLCIL